MENWRKHIKEAQFRHAEVPQVFREKPVPVAPEEAKKEMMISGMDYGLIMWGTKVENYKWYKGNLIIDKLPQRKPFDLKLADIYKKQYNEKTIPPIFVFAKFYGDYWDEGNWRLQVADGEHRIWAFKDFVETLPGYFAIPDSEHVKIEDFLKEKENETDI
jgi:hypothetical protein